MNYFSEKKTGQFSYSTWKIESRKLIFRIWSYFVSSEDERSKSCLSILQNYLVFCVKRYDWLSYFIRITWVYSLKIWVEFFKIVLRCWESPVFFSQSAAKKSKFSIFSIRINFSTIQISYSKSASKTESNDICFEIFSWFSVFG